MSDIWMKVLEGYRAVDERLKRIEAAVRLTPEPQEDPVFPHPWEHQGYTRPGGAIKEPVPPESSGWSPAGA